MPERAPVTFYLALLGTWLILGIALAVGAAGGPLAIAAYVAIIGLLVLDAIAYVREGGEFAYWRFLWLMCLATVPPVALSQSISG